MDQLQRYGLAIAAAIFLVVAALALLAPEALFSPIGVTWDEPSGPAELRAAYFGLFGACGVMFARAVRRTERWGNALFLLALVLGGFVAGRGFSLVVDGVPSAIGWVNFVVESAGLGLCVAILRWRHNHAQLPTQQNR